MAQAASAMKTTIEVLKWSKGQGCPAFRSGGRIDETSWRAWFAEHGERIPAATEHAPLREQKLSEEIRKLRIRNDRDSGALIPKRLVADFHAKFASEVDQLLEQKLANEYPSAVAGLDVAQARVYGKRLGDDVRRLLNEVSRRLCA